MVDFKEKTVVSSAYSHSEDMTKTWVSRLTDSSNLWLNAIRCEDEKDINKACLLYLSDARNSLNSGSLIKAALSCSCAASCIYTLGYASYSRKFYLESAKMYEENADLAVKTSIREALWSLEKAYINYIIARENIKAESVYNKFLNLSRRVNPFLDESETIRLRPMVNSSENGKTNNLSVELRKALADFLNFRSSHTPKLAEKAGVRK